MIDERLPVSFMPDESDFMIQATEKASAAVAESLKKATDFTVCGSSD